MIAIQHPNFSTFSSPANLQSTSKHLPTPKINQSVYPRIFLILQLISVNPGLCKTELGREQESWMFSAMILLLARTAEMGSRTLVHAAVGPDAENLKGEYLSD